MSAPKPLAYRSRDRLLRLVGRLRQWRAALTGKRFACRSLSGEARDGLFVNSDMTVSCNCQDIDGRGQLGNLRTSALEWLLAGPKATAFRRSLAEGHLPLPRCAACWHLRMVNAADAAATAEHFETPKGLSVENTVRCNLRCLSCCRDKILETRHGQHSLDLADVETVSQTLARIGADYCGYYNLGEPFLAPTIRDELRIVRQHNPTIKILISTNGVHVDTDAKREAALLADDVLFSLDGVTTPMVQKYQRGGDFDRAYENLRRLVEYRDTRGLSRPRIFWKYVVFRWNDRRADIERAVALARDAGVDCLQFTFARSPWHGISWRFFLTATFRNLGERDGWRFRNVWLREPSDDVCFTVAPKRAKAA